MDEAINLVAIGFKPSLSPFKIGIPPTIADARSPACLMITISTSKGLIKVENWDEIQNRFGFVKDLDASAHKLDTIIGRYKFEDKVACGLSHCRTLHSRGYIVTTKDGHETNIGKDCGRKYFGVDFEILANQFDRDLTEQENREFLWNFKLRLPELRARIEAMRKGAKGADWVHRYSDLLITPSTRCPKEISRQVADMVKTKSNSLIISREATEQEIQKMENDQKKSLPRPHYVHETIAQIAGLEALYPENNLKKLLVLDLEENIKALNDLNIDLLSFEQLSRWKRWAGTVENVLESATSIVSTGHVLLTYKNLKPLVNVLTDYREIPLFEGFLAALNGTPVHS